MQPLLYLAASDGEIVAPPAVDFQPDWILMVNWLVAVLLPVLVGLVTNRLTASLVKHLILAGLAGVSTLAGEFLRVASTGEPFDLFTALFTFGSSMIVAWLTYDKIWKPAGVTQSAQEIGMSEKKIAEAEERDAA